MGIAIKNICPWSIAFESLLKEHGEMFAPFEESDRLTEEEIQYQIERGNIGFVGLDGFGSHAPLQLTDLDEYNRLFGCEKSKLPEYFDESTFKKMIRMKDETKFKAALEKNVKTESEKRILIYLLSKDDKVRKGLPDWMIWAIQSYTEMKV